jgi:hypothetical protein
MVSPYTLEIPMSKIQAMEILHPLRAVDELQVLSVIMHSHEERTVPIVYGENYCFWYTP